VERAAAPSEPGVEVARTVERVAPPRLPEPVPARFPYIGDEAAPRARLAPCNRAALRERRVLLPDDGAAAAHAYRMLRTQLLRRVRAERLKTIGVVSAVDGEGKTLTAVNLALSIAAEPNQTVLLVDLDLRQPQMAKLLGLSVVHGLEAWLEGTVSELAPLYVGLEGLERLRVLPTLRPLSGSSELLAGARGRELPAALAGAAGADTLAIVDLPPVLLADDVLAFAPLLDGVLLVVSEGRTKREDVLRTRELLHGVRLLGTVLNVASESEKRTYS